MKTTLKIEALAQFHFWNFSLFSASLCLVVVSGAPFFTGYWNARLRSEY